MGSTKSSSIHMSAEMIEGDDHMESINDQFTYVFKVLKTQTCYDRSSFRAKSRYTEQETPLKLVTLPFGSPIANSAVSNMLSTIIETDDNHRGLYWENRRVLDLDAMLLNISEKAAQLGRPGARLLVTIEKRFVVVVPKKPCLGLSRERVFPRSMDLVSLLHLNS